MDVTVSAFRTEVSARIVWQKQFSPIFRSPFDKVIEKKELDALNSGEKEFSRRKPQERKNETLRF